MKIPTQPGAGQPTPPATPLEHLLARAAQSQEDEKAFIAALLASNLFLATPLQPGVTTVTLAPGQAVDFFTVEPPGGGPPVAAMFTSPQRIVECFGPGLGFLQMPAASLLAMVSPTGGMLNPNGLFSVMWRPQDIAAMLGG
jgi:hypothetical protein